ncbi:MAG TPA: J domain-containing protein [Puia sp.]|uniref:J domain-containing protein n=1 Tax=Puia sp. TaxID=2045100 RepID=UPI002C716D4A|nr:J domain-containing protein [Puia sp.]HVU96881.1 J domain-containing protein [Puia sp.]
MTAKGKEVTAANLAAFITSHRLCVLNAQYGVALGFNKSLNYQLTQKYGLLLNTGTVDLSKLDYKSPKIQEFLNVWIPNLGLPRATTIYPGYYLFKEGTLVAYHPGTMDPSQMDSRVDGIMAIFGAVAGILTGVLSNNAALGFQTFFDSITASTGLRMFSFFKEILEINDNNYSKIRNLLVYEDDLSKAYKLLRVTPENSDEEIKAARNKLIKEVHPDKNQNEKDNEAKTKATAQINNAYELIVASRKKNNKGQP